MGNPGGTVLTGGRWARGTGGIYRWIGERPTDIPARRIEPNRNEVQRTKPCPGGCGTKIRPMRTFCLDCHDAIQLMPALLVPRRPVCRCGCLLAYTGEDCPNCRVELIGQRETRAA